MRKKTFFGLILLIIMLLVISTPALLTPSAKGIEMGLLKVGMLERSGSGTASKKSGDDAATGDPLEARLELKGHIVEDNGDLRDTASVNDRASNQRGRVIAGSTRVAMPGQQQNQDAYSKPPVLAKKGLLLDSTGCPIFPESTNLVLLLADPDTEAAYAKRAAAADNPPVCEASLNAQVRASVRGTSSALPSDLRRSAASIRSDSERFMIDQQMNAMYAAIFDDWTTASKDATKIQSSLRSTR